MMGDLLRMRTVKLVSPNFRSEVVTLVESERNEARNVNGTIP